MLLASAFLLGAFFLFVYRQKRQEYLLVWAAGWLLISLHFIGPLLGSRIQLPNWFDAFNEWLLAVAALAFYCAARLYARLRLAIRGVTAANCRRGRVGSSGTPTTPRACLELSASALIFFLVATYLLAGGP